MPRIIIERSNQLRAVRDAFVIGYGFVRRRRNSSTIHDSSSAGINNTITSIICPAKGRKFYRVVEARCTENGRCILVPGPKERVSRGPGFVGARFGT